MSGTRVIHDNPEHAAIARLAQALGSLMLDTMLDDASLLNWEDTCFAAAIAMKGLAEMSARMQERPVDATLQELRTVIEAGLRQEIVLQRFKDRAEMEAWNAARHAADEPDGTVH